MSALSPKRSHTGKPSKRAKKDVTPLAGGTSDAQGSKGNALSWTFKAESGEVLSPSDSHTGAASTGTAKQCSKWSALSPKHSHTSKPSKRAKKVVTPLAGGTSDAQGSKGNALSSTLEAESGDVLSPPDSHTGAASTGTAKQRSKGSALSP